MISNNMHDLRFFFTLQTIKSLFTDKGSVKILIYVDEIYYILFVFCVVPFVCISYRNQSIQFLLQVLSA